MASKAKSGMSAVRQFVEKIRELTPPNDYVVAALSFTGPVRDGQGHAAFHAGVSNTTVGILSVLMAWRSTGPFVKVASVTAALDPVSGLFTAEIVTPIIRRYVQVVFDAAAPGLGADFELGGYFEPRSDSDIILAAGGVPISSSTSPGTVITSPADTPVAPAAVAALPAPPGGTIRMRVQVTLGDAATRIRVREAGGVAGTGIILTLLGSTMYGGANEGSIAPLEVENIAGPAAAVAIQFERP